MKFPNVITCQDFEFFNAFKEKTSKEATGIFFERRKTRLALSLSPLDVMESKQTTRAATKSPCSKSWLKILALASVGANCWMRQRMLSIFYLPVSLNSQ